MVVHSARGGRRDTRPNGVAAPRVASDPVPRRVAELVVQLPRIRTGQQWVLHMAVVRLDTEVSSAAATCTINMDSSKWRGHRLALTLVAGTAVDKAGAMCIVAGDESFEAIRVMFLLKEIKLV